VRKELHKIKEAMNGIHVVTLIISLVLVLILSI
jgi:hypothetical protein